MSIGSRRTAPRAKRARASNQRGTPTMSSHDAPLTPLEQALVEALVSAVVKELREWDDVIYFWRSVLILSS